MYRKIPKITLPKGPFGLIVADPPWPVRTSRKGDLKGFETMDYPLMSWEDINRLPVGDISSPDAILLLWVLQNEPHQYLKTVQAWGFEPKSELIWVKVSSKGTIYPGMGYHVRLAHERVIVATRGNWTPKDKGIPSVFTAEKGKHSAKPDVFYEIADRMSGGLPKLEMFCRTPREGWTVWGNEVK